MVGGIPGKPSFGNLLPLAGQATVKSNVAEDPVYSIARGYQASNLIDGNTRTLAYPGSRQIDYQVSLGQLMQLSSVAINWGGYGTSNRRGVGGDPDVNTQ